MSERRRVSALSANGYEFEAAGESCEVRVSLSDIVQWQIENKLAWLTVSGSTNRVGPGTVTLQAAPNDTIHPRSGTVTIARKTFKVSQKARGVEVEYDTKLFGTDGGSDSISIHRYPESLRRDGDPWDHVLALACLVRREADLLDVGSLIRLVLYGRPRAGMLKLNLST